MNHYSPMKHLLKKIQSKSTSRYVVLFQIAKSHVVEDRHQNRVLAVYRETISCIQYIISGQIRQWFRVGQGRAEEYLWLTIFFLTHQVNFIAAPLFSLCNFIRKNIRWSPTDLETAMLRISPTMYHLYLICIITLNGKVLWAML